MMTVCVCVCKIDSLILRSILNEIFGVCPFLSYSLLRKGKSVSFERILKRCKGWSLTKKNLSKTVVNTKERDNLEREVSKKQKRSLKPHQSIQKGNWKLLKISKHLIYIPLNKPLPKQDFFLFLFLPLYLSFEYFYLCRQWAGTMWRDDWSCDQSLHMSHLLGDQQADTRLFCPIDSGWGLEGWALGVCSEKW